MIGEPLQYVAPKLYRPLAAGELIPKGAVYFDHLGREQLVSSVWCTDPFNPVKFGSIMFVPVTAPAGSAYAGPPNALVQAREAMQKELAVLQSPPPVTKAEEWLPLGPEDVAPGSVFRYGGWSKNTYRSPLEVCETGIIFQECQPTYQQLMDTGAEISRDFGKTWHPCRKRKPFAEAPATEPEEPSLMDDARDIVESIQDHFSDLAARKLVEFVQRIAGKPSVE